MSRPGVADPSPSLSSRRARIAGPVSYALGDGSPAAIPLGDCTITVANNVATVQWGAVPEATASFASAVIDQYENLGAIAYLD